MLEKVWSTLDDGDLDGTIGRRLNGLKYLVFYRRALIHDAT